MPTEKEIWTAANQIIQQYGDAADVHASMRANNLLEEGDTDGHLVWLRILKAIRSLADVEPGERVH